MEHHASAYPMLKKRASVICSEMAYANSSADTLFSSVFALVSRNHSNKKIVSPDGQLWKSRDRIPNKKMPQA
ncbi:hypothetical protein A2924_03495 [Candidatus Giovannonibacteria bacterium RIFCSPLOWO2_01_FULL_44_16]|uniref:Uncharacterized protein n=1 Tax=Candidatus Giovannonibacteria bacterium RIFCSPLOWO2_01_FULL_44_16 TaxID=1798348 RepID=A0A1F5X4E9_9BACT|nr:MAG: hypothetical protein A2924_03495 [Candidatus Giovannonibacteria bacterium RIFCSPLOWO2_01_FULL_44_16]